VVRVYGQIGFDGKCGRSGLNRSGGHRTDDLTVAQGHLIQ